MSWHPINEGIFLHKGKRMEEIRLWCCTYTPGPPTPPLYYSLVRRRRSKNIQIDYPPGKLNPMIKIKQLVHVNSTKMSIEHNKHWGCHTVKSLMVNDEDGFLFEVHPKYTALRQNPSKTLMQIQAPASLTCVKKPKRANSGRKSGCKSSGPGV